VPHAPGGPEAGTIATAFDCITGGESAAIGHLHFVATPPGCLVQIESSYPGGTHVVSCAGEVDPVPEWNRGRICVDQGGYDACEPAATPVEARSWGRVKAQYAN